MPDFLNDYLNYYLYEHLHNSYKAYEYNVKAKYNLFTLLIYT